MTFFLSNYKAIGVAILLAVLTWFVWAFVSRGAKIDQLNESMDRIVVIANDNAVKAKELQDKADEAASILADAARKADQRVNAARKREKEILNVSKDKDGAVAPVLRDTLERLRAEPNDRKD